MLTPEEKQRIEDEERRRIAEEQYRAQVRAELQRSAPPGPPAGSPPRPKRSLPKVALSFAVLVVLLAAAIAVLSSVVTINRRGKRRSDISESSGGRVYPVPDWQQAANNKAFRENQQAIKNLNACAAGTAPQSDGTCAPEADSLPSTPTAPSLRYVPVTQQIASGQVVVPARGYVQYRIEIPLAGRDAHVSGTFNASGGRGNDVDASLSTESEFVNWINGHQARVAYGTAGRKTTDTFDVRLGPGTYIFAISNRFSEISSKYVFLDVKLNYQRTEDY